MAGPKIDQNVNINYNPAIGVNDPFTDISRRPFPDWGGYVNGEVMEVFNPFNHENYGSSHDVRNQFAVRNAVVQQQGRVSAAAYCSLGSGSRSK